MAPGEREPRRAATLSIRLGIYADAEQTHTFVQTTPFLDCDPMGRPDAAWLRDHALPGA